MELPEIFRLPEDHLDFYQDELALPANAMIMKNQLKEQFANKNLILLGMDSKIM